MKEMLTQLLIECDVQNHDTTSCAQMSPSSSIEEIAEYISLFMAEQ